jgi:hypothetical protein
MLFAGRIVRAFRGAAFLLLGMGYLNAQGVTDPPLSIGDKWEFATGETFDPLAILDLGAGAALRQQQDQFPSFGQGVFGFAKRYGVAFGNHAGSDYLTGAVFPILLKEDPRYFRMGKGGFFRRFFYAASRIPVTRTDKGTNRFNFSEIIGNAAAATLSNVYLPHGDRTPSYSAETFGLFLGSDALVNIAKEFWPNVRHKLFHGPPAGGSTPSPQGLVH